MNPPLPAIFEEPVSDPVQLYRMRDGLAAVDLLSAAIVHLDFFSWLADHPSTLGAICVNFQTHTRPTDVMMTLFTAMGLVTIAGGVFHLTLRGREHLTSGSKFNLAPYYAALKDRPQTLDMVKVLRTGKPSKFGSYDPQEWAKAMERPDFAAQFTAAMDARGVLLGPALAKKIDLADYRNVLDIAGGSGIYSYALVAQQPHLRAAVLEKPPVDQIAQRCIDKYGCGDRVEVRVGDIFQDPLPKDFDVHLWSNVLHDWDEPAVRNLLAASRDALPQDGLIIIHDAFLKADKTGPLDLAEYSALLMQITEGKCYSYTEMRHFLFDAGFEFIEHQPTAVGRSYISARRL